MPVVTLTTDFGNADGYVAAMKAVILGRVPGVTFVDISHDLPAQGVLAGALLLESVAPLFPPGTVHLAVVDPGVGSARRAVAVGTARHCFVGPDNGLFALALARDPPAAVVALDNQVHHRRPVCPTFHGRDVFAPAAAHLAGGGALADLGSAVASLLPVAVPSPVQRPGGVELHVLHADRFGNLVLDLDAAALERWRAAHPGAVPRFSVGGREVLGVDRTFSDVEVGAPVAFVGSAGRLEIALRDGDAAGALGVRAGAVVWLR